MADHVRKVRDENPPLDFTLQESSNGTLVAFNLTNYKPRFVLRSSGNTVIADGTTANGQVSILNTTGGRVRMTLDSTHVDTVGMFYGEWELTDPSTKRITFPSLTQVTILLKPEIVST